MKKNYLMVDHIMKEGKHFDGKEGPGLMLSKIANEINKEVSNPGYPSGETLKVLKKAGVDPHPGMDKEAVYPLYDWIKTVLESLGYSFEEFVPEAGEINGNNCFTSALKEELISVDWRGAREKVTEGVPIVIISGSKKGAETGTIGLLTPIGEMKEESEFVVATINGFFENFEIFNINFMDRPSYFLPKKKDNLPK